MFIIDAALVIFGVLVVAAWLYEADSIGRPGR